MNVKYEIVIPKYNYIQKKKYEKPENTVSQNVIKQITDKLTKQLNESEKRIENKLNEHVNNQDKKQVELEKRITHIENIAGSALSYFDRYKDGLILMTQEAQQRRQEQNSFANNNQLLQTTNYASTNHLEPTQTTSMAYETQLENQ
jgi:hypothetical protein